MFEFLVQQQSQRKVIVYWGLRDQSACYELNKTQNTIDNLVNGSFHAVVETPNDEWQGRKGIVHEVVMKDIKHLAQYDIYLAGRFDMVGAVRRDFIAQGADINQMYADAFAYI
jgi:aquacobalamin reductase/NAD(P)H-flavin reductase